MTALWFFIRLFVVLAIGLWIAGLDGRVLLYAYGYEVHIRLWVMLVFIAAFVVTVWYILRTIGWVNAGVFYMTRTRKLYKHIAALPHILRGTPYLRTPPPTLRVFAKKHPVYQLLSYQANPQFHIHIADILPTPYAGHLIQACITHNHTEKLSEIRAFYTTEPTVTPPPVFYIYESTVAESLQKSLTHLSYVGQAHLKNDVAYYTAITHIRHTSADACTKVLQAWKATQTTAQKWRLCLACRDMVLSDITHIVPFENIVHKKDGMGMLLLAVLSIKLQLWGPADAYITQSQPYVQADKVAFVRAYLAFLQHGDSLPYIAALRTYDLQKSPLIL